MKPYFVEQINTFTYQIAEVFHLPAALPMFLIAGDTSAVLIDTGCGIGDLRGTVEEITDLPVSVCNTHIHLDHAGANMQFDQVYMHPSEIKRANLDLPKAARLEFVELKCMYDPTTDVLLSYAREQIAEYDPNYPKVAIQDGDKINLGGLTLDVIGTPGHTPGCLVYVDHQHGNAFCGDTCNPRVSIFGPREALATYSESLQRLLDLTIDINHYYVGHRLFAFSRDDVHDLMVCADEILSGAKGEPYPMIVSRGKPMWGRIHWYNGKRIVYFFTN